MKDEENTVPDNLQNKALFAQVVALLQNARQQVLRTVNSTMVYTYFEIGRMTVEEEQNGKERAKYGKQLLKGLSEKLTIKFGKGFSVENLDRMRKFYKTYSISSSLITKLNLEKSDTLLRISKNSISQSLTGVSENQKEQSLISFFKLTWTHYVLLMRIDDERERRFYEIESEKYNWSVRELKRQYNSALYTRLALSREREMRLEDENKTIGIVLCQNKSDLAVEYTLPENNEQFFASKYKTILPSREDLIQLISESR
ncbi:PDDEXK nuclease domain-containing protein [Flavobacterium sp. LB3P45]|uniref:PDDEXK nuclease domain-containing protein n=1 Tax=Flavobacterium fructosi TaxID=3230416 RepID=A0ABW6HP11_9FLAO